MATIKGNKMKNEAIGQDELCAMVNKITGENHTTDTHGFMAFDSSVNLVAPNNFLKNECNHIIGIDNGMGDMWEGIIYEDSEKVKKHDLRELALERLDVPDDFKDKLRLAMKNNG